MLLRVEDPLAHVGSAEGGSLGSLTGQPPCALVQLPSELPVLHFPGHFDAAVLLDVEVHL